MRRLFILAAIALTPSLATAQCQITIPGTACVTVPQPLNPPPPPVEIGQHLERGQYSMLMNARYYGLPSARDGWVYLRIEDDIYRVDWRTHEVLERVTDQAAKNW